MRCVKSCFMFESYEARGGGEECAVYFFSCYFVRLFEVSFFVLCLIFRGKRGGGEEEMLSLRSAS